MNEANMELVLEKPAAVCISKLSSLTVLCAGPWYLNYIRNQCNDEDPAYLEGSGDPESLGSGGVSTSKLDPDDVDFLRKLNPKEWKNQDHYAVLGLSKVRHLATDGDIKKAYREKVRSHHPDKRKARGEEILPDDDYFTCITKAWETLGSLKNRRAYDSVDPLFDNTLPPNNDQSKKAFFETFAPVFRRNERWSIKSPVPRLGTEFSPREEVDKFYSFWYNFQSWREYSYLDEEEKEKGQGREERKWIERQNKVAREKLKKEEMARIRQLVDTAYALDPRILKFKQEEKDRKLAAKQAKRDAAKARKEEEERRLREEEEEAKRKKEEEEAEEEARRNVIKAEKDAHKKELKQKRTVLRKLVKGNNYYTKENDEMLRHMATLEKMCESLSAEDIQHLVDRLQSEGRDAYVGAMGDIERRLQEEQKASMDSIRQKYTAAAQEPAEKRPNARNQWSHEELQLLIKAVNVFPPGTSRRWEVVANFINQHRPPSATGGSIARTAKDVLSKAKDLQSSDFTRNALKVSANTNAYYNCCERTKVSAAETPVTAQPQAGKQDTAAADDKSEERQEDKKDSSSPWTTTEQQLLEQALRTYPASTPDRWDKISECVPSRGKKECMRRYKELVELVKAKKAAQALVSQCPNKK